MRTLGRRGGVALSQRKQLPQLRLCSSSNHNATQSTSSTTSSSVAGGVVGGASAVASAKTKLRGWKVDVEDGVGGFDGFSQPGKGTFDGFMNTNKRLRDFATSQGIDPCDVAGSDAVTESKAAELLAQASATGKLPSPKRQESAAAGPSPAPSHPPAAAASAAVASGGEGKKEPTPIARSSLPPRATLERRAVAPPTSQSSSSSEGQSKAKQQQQQPRQPEPEYTGHLDAAEYYKDMPMQELSKEQMWARIQRERDTREEVVRSGINVEEAEYLKMETELKENDLYHFRLGEYAFSDENQRRDYWAMWQLAMSLNKARWTQLEVHAQQGVKGTGAGIKSLFWKESLYSIAEKRDVPIGQFVDAHPILRPFASAVKRAPHTTKAFIRGFADARLRVMQQPGNVKQLLEHFDKFYGYFFNTMLELLGIHDEHSEHVMCHVGRAIGITQHCVMLWKKYAKLGTTMLPADLCADHQVNLVLLKNISLASRDRAVRQVLCTMMALAKEELLHALEAAKQCDVRCWPIVMECTYPNFYCGFLQRFDFNVGALLADHGIENPFLWWYRFKKTVEWERKHDISLLLAERAPFPYTNIVLLQRESQLRRSALPKESAASDVR